MFTTLIHVPAVLHYRKINRVNWLYARVGPKITLNVFEKRKTSVFHYGEPGMGLIYQGLWEMDDSGSGSGACLSEGGQWGEPGGGGTPLLGTPKDMLSKALDMYGCFHRGHAFGEHEGMFFS